MRKTLAGMAAVFIAGMMALSSFGDDVYAKAFYWCRGMGVDANGNGKLDSGELYDSLNLHTPTSSDVGTHHPVFTNEMVRMPYRGVLRQTQCSTCRRRRSSRTRRRARATCARTRSRCRRML